MTESTCCCSWILSLLVSYIEAVHRCECDKPFIWTHHNKTLWISHNLKQWRNKLDYFKIETENTELEKSAENDTYIITTPISKYYYATKEGSKSSFCKSKPTESLTSLGWNISLQTPL